MEAVVELTSASMRRKHTRYLAGFPLKVRKTLIILNIYYLIIGSNNVTNLATFLNLCNYFIEWEFLMKKIHESKLEMAISHNYL